MKKLPNAHGFYSLILQYHLLPSMHLEPHGVSLMIGWWRKRVGPGFLMVLHIIQVLSRSGQLWHYIHFLRQPWKTHQWRKIFIVSKQNFGQYHGVITFCFEEKWSENVELFTNSWIIANRLPGWSGIWKVWLEDWWERSLGKKYVDWSLQMDKGCKHTCAM